MKVVFTYKNTSHKEKIFRNGFEVIMNLKYNLSLTSYVRFPTREVKVGHVGIGGKNPIRVQSMTTSDTQDTEATVKQILELENVGCEIVRITVPSQKDADNLPNIRQALKKHGSKIPIVADIHFTPSIAMKVVEYVEKVRINPGNFADKKKFVVHEYSDEEYNKELERIAEVFLPLVRRCKELGVAMRIGTNHGSLSDRIMNRYGDTPLGMVESALEFIKIAESENYKEIVVSMKASNPQVMVQAYRLLVAKFLETGRDYPIHLGVTEAGDGVDGRIKSIMGIGSLLEDGIGDTVRVSLTEDAIHEIPVAQRLVKKYNDYILNNKRDDRERIEIKEFRNPFSYSRFFSAAVPVGDLRVGENYPVRVETKIDICEKEKLKEEIKLLLNTESFAKPEIFYFDVQNEKELFDLAEIKKDFSNLPFSVSFYNWKEFDLLFDLKETIARFEKVCFSFQFCNQNLYDFIHIASFLTFSDRSIEIQLLPSDISNLTIFVDELKKQKLNNFLFSLRTGDIVYDYRSLAYVLSNYDYPILLSSIHNNFEDALYEASLGIGSLLL
ncbi:MAG: (E)-4-hydroxy-3-methylbut-2-enyl-diphosphate synthase, partial [Leptospiraceae bacterium]|nr:(E)-4-hydroxy-3-methylbut-2-enyl-diphosphate synthase [Leptospiraceae bacterium]